MLQVILTKNMKLGMDKGEYIRCQERETTLPSDKDKRETALVIQPAWAQDVMQHNIEAILFVRSTLWTSSYFADL